MISLIIPVYNRPEEVDELLATLVEQTYKEFEVVIVEDGSTVDCRAVVEKYSDKLDISYTYQPNGGPSVARNTGSKVAKGDFLVVMDSDCLVPAQYFENVQRHIEQGVQFYGGADSAAADFSPLQKAISYSMTSFFTTGGIRGSKKSIEKFSPRSFNLGITKELYHKVGGFSDMRVGEDIDFSHRVTDMGVEAVYLPDATVFHKRRTSFRLFFKQVFLFGMTRINLNIKHKESRKLVFYLPFLFFIGSLGLIVCAPIFSWWLLAPFALLMLLWFSDSSIRNRSVKVGWLAIWTSFIQLYGYAIGFCYGIWVRLIRRQPEEATWKATRFFSQKTR